MKLVRAGPADAAVISGLLEDYLRELDRYRIPSNQTGGSHGYPYLDAYWLDAGRHAFLIRSGGRVVGFVFVRDPASTGSTVHELAEFYVKPDSRRLGIGRKAAAALWKDFPGEWELQVSLRNSSAVGFWTSCIESVTGVRPEVSEMRAQDGARVKFHFDVENPV